MKSSLLSLVFLGSLSCAETEFSAWSYTEKDLFPSAIISTATVDWNGEQENAEDKKTDGDEELEDGEIPFYGDENGWLGVELFGLPEGAEVEVEVSVDGFMKPSKWKGTIDLLTEDGEAHVIPKGIWDYAALHKATQQRPANATFRVTVNGKALTEQNETCVVKSINDCPFYVLWDEEGEDYEDLSWLFAAYVNENHPWVDGILKEAIKSGLVKSFTGYQSGDPDEVMMQVFAIWNVLQRKGIKYSDISSTTPSKFVVSQTVRFLDQSIDATQANCVDGSVLMASILQKIGINSYLVMVPGHCFLAFDTGKGEDDVILGLETTMLGNDDLEPVSDLSNLPEKELIKGFEASYNTFGNAIEVGCASMEEHADAFEDGSNPAIQIISIKEARELGIAPIAFGGKD
ncbi:MAG: hypothetical protein RLZZ505_1557 [Verrucomicrobiota bacterium]|jgi:hypothetical protein